MIMNNDEMKLFVQKTRTDGEAMLSASEMIFQLSRLGIWILGALGGIATLISIQISIGAAFGTLISTLLGCFLMYVVSIFIRYACKVFVNISYACTATLEKSSNG
jgi:hypothetical protein